MMKIAFDAKRAYENGTGLGHYSRTLLSSLATFYPDHQYYLCAPKITNRFHSSSFNNMKNITPATFLSKMFSPVWRSNWIKKDLQNLGIDLYHGLSHEIPVGINQTGIRTVVTIHDLIFERYPKQYNPIDVQIYRKKFRYACEHADEIIAISRQTKEDIIQYYQIPEDKISICYQSCNQAFAKQISSHEKEAISRKYQLPAQFFLYVGSIIERKNLLVICKAINMIRHQWSIPLVVIGEGGEYLKQVKSYVQEQKLQEQVLFLSETEAAKQSIDFQNAADFPAIYQLATALIYPSIFEGFGIPVLEALWSKLPVITSNISCLPETGGDAAYYIDPFSPGDLAVAMQKLVTDNDLQLSMIAKGEQQAQKFTLEKCAASVMQVYLRLL